MSDYLPWIQLIIAAAVILFTSKYLAKSADNIATKTGLGRSFIGVVLLATATSLPELGTGINAVSRLDAPDLAAGDVFGSNIFNLLIVVVLDSYWRNRSFLGSVYKSTWITATLSISLIILTLIALWNPGEYGFSIGNVGLLSYLLIIFFIISMFIIYKMDKNQMDHSPQTPDISTSTTLTKSFLVYLVSATLIIISSIFLSGAGEEIAHMMNWGESFVGTQLLALSTSLPELATSIAAVRLKAPELAITNLLGSNLFNTGIVLFVDDLFYTNGPIWDQLSNAHIFNGVIAIIMTLVIVTVILIQPKNKTFKFISLESIFLTSCYLIATIYTFQNP
ncbi:MAG: sodium:calcium antiporter [SAR202 cluster bacterium]|nr:hypothetical protein [Chloroflexota bacterium]MQG38671.1 sodium:calcium antiporter [SAR202 cluster bacterium]|tara:strand:+ start:571 stop:1578 length:1008 start_codon:yes stop_codon:yes gene_type:complete